MKAKVSGKGQVVISVALRRKFGVKIGDMVDLVVEREEDLRCLNQLRK